MEATWGIVCGEPSCCGSCPSRWCRLLGAWLERVASTAGIDPAEDVEVRVAVQAWATRQGVGVPGDVVETVTQFPDCSTLTIRTSSGLWVPVVAVRTNGVWVVSRALNDTNDRDAVWSSATCRAVFQE